MKSIAFRTGAISGVASDDSRYSGAYPAATKRAFRSRSGTSSASASRQTMSRLGWALPVST
jgi:hypothetical protein